MAIPITEPRTTKRGTCSYCRTLAVLADRAFPNCSGEQRLELVRNQFIRGNCSPTVKDSKLIREMPWILEEAIEMAAQQELVEAA